MAASSTWAAAPAKTSCTWRPRAMRLGDSTSWRWPSSGPRPRPPSEESTPISSSGNALELNKLGRQFDTVIDCGLFHTFSDEERPLFVEGLGEVLRSGGLLHILCFSDEEPGTEGPRRVTQQEIRDAFQNGWKVEQIEPTRFESVECAGQDGGQPRRPEGMAGDD